MRPLRLIAGFGWATAACFGAVPVYRGHLGLLPIFVRAGACSDEKAAAEELARVLGRMSGTEWSICPARDASAKGIYVGAVPKSPGGLVPLRLAADVVMPGAGEVGPDAFRIRTMGGSVYIVGATPWALRYAVDWLLEHEAGVRWYCPGPIGEIIPHPSEWSLAELDVQKAPAYVSREFSGFESPEGAEWARRNGLHKTLDFGHALSRVFRPELYANHHEWFPELFGKRHRPSSVEDRDWQPNLALPEVAERAAHEALAAFLREPGLSSFSLGINDTVRFDQGPMTRRIVEPVHYFGGMPDYSPLVYAFMNRTADAVTPIAPDKYLGCLAYFWCQNPPPFAVRGNVFPYVCADRSQYFDSDYRRKDLDLMARWGASGAKAFGIWEYAYGSGFVIPREPVAALAEAIREGWMRGARGYFAEIGAYDGMDTFKAWALAQLLWEPGLSLSKLEDDFFPGYYGRAGSTMRRFFECCQDRWMGQGGAPFWLKYFGQADQALLFPKSTCDLLRGYLSEAGRIAAGDPAVLERIAVASRDFALTEAYAAFDSERRSLEAACPGANEAFPGGEGALAEAVGRFAGARSRLESAHEGAGPNACEKAAELRLPESLLRDDPVPRLLFCAGRRDTSAPRRILEEAGPIAASRVAWRAMAEAVDGDLPEAPNLAANSSFVEPAGMGQEPRFLYAGYGELPAGWKLAAMPTEKGGALLAEEETSVGGQGRRSLRIEGAWETQFYQWLPARPGIAYLATARLRGRTSPGGDAALYLTILSASGSVLCASLQTLPKGDTPGWRDQALCERAPAGAGWVGVGVGCVRQTPGDWMEADSVEIRAGRGAGPP